MMRKSQNIKDKDYVSAGSGLLLFLLAFLTINPVSGVAFAEETDASADDPNTLDAQSDEVNYDDQIMATAATASTVNIAFNPTSANGTVTPVDASGAKAKVDVTATVRVQNSGGYSVYVGSSSSQLKAGSNVIDSVASSTTYENMPLNRWGYSFAKGTTASNTYNAMPATLRGTALDSNTSTSIKDETRTYTLSFAANIGADKPAGTYTNQVTMSVVSSPLEIVNDFGIATMQEMTSTVCSTATDNDSDGQISAQLEDVRDGKYYWVAKLADNKCWMTQNLDLDLSTSKALTPADSDVASNWTPQYTTATQATSSTILADNTGQRSWSLGNYRIVKPTISNDCGSGKADLAACVDGGNRFTAYNTPTTVDGDVNAHYIVGNHYQWNTATAGTGGAITSGQATGSICPKGWRLPTSNAGGEFATLVAALGGTSSTDNVTQAPFYGVRGGIVYQGTGLLNYAGDRGYYWSSIPRSSDRAYHLRFYGSTTVDPSYYDSGSRQLGYSVRCIAK